MAHNLDSDVSAVVPRAGGDFAGVKIPKPARISADLEDLIQECNAQIRNCRRTIRLILVLVIAIPCAVLASTWYVHVVHYGLSYGGGPSSDEASYFMFLFTAIFVGAAGMLVFLLATRSQRTAIIQWNLYRIGLLRLLVVAEVQGLDGIRPALLANPFSADTSASQNAVLVNGQE